MEQKCEHIFQFEGGHGNKSASCISCGLVWKFCVVPALQPGDTLEIRDRAGLIKRSMEKLDPMTFEIPKTFALLRTAES